MSDSKTLQDLITSIKEFYGDLEHPNHSLMAINYQSLQRSPLILELMKEFFIKDETDLNDHAALHLKVLLDPGAMVVCLSFISPWAMLFRLDEDNLIYVRVLEKGDPSLLPNEARVLTLVSDHRFRIIGKRDAMAKLPMSLFNTECQDVRIYHAIIDDCGVVPAVLCQPGDM